MYNPSDKSLMINREDAPQPLGARAQSKERNRQKILESAMTLFRERGFEAATLRDILQGEHFEQRRLTGTGLADNVQVR